MENDEVKKAREAAEAPLAEALNFLTKGWMADPVLKDAINRAIGCLKGGDASDQAHAELLQAYLAYPGSTAAQEAAFRLHKAIRTPEGRTAAGLPRRARKKEHDLINIKPTDELFQIFFLAENKRNFRDDEIRRALEDHFDADLSKETRARLTKELKQIVKDYSQFHQKFMAAREEKKRLI